MAIQEETFETDVSFILFVHSVIRYVVNMDQYVERLGTIRLGKKRKIIKIIPIFVCLNMPDISLCRSVNSFGLRCFLGRGCGLFICLYKV